LKHNLPFEPPVVFVLTSGVIIFGVKNNKIQNMVSIGVGKPNTQKARSKKQKSVCVGVEKYFV